MKRKWIGLFVLLTLINVAIYLFKDHFQYIKYSTYNDLYGECNDACEQKWKSFLPHYSATDIADSKVILQSLEINSSSTTLDKIKRIGQHLYTNFHTQQGFPRDTIHKSEPPKQYKILKADTTQKLWCGTWAQMFAYFCGVENIICRYIEVFKPGDHHVLNECYLPEEKKWVMIDLTSGILLVEKNKRLLNFQEFLSAAYQTTVVDAINFEKKSFNRVVYKNDVVKYYSKEYPTYYYHVTNLERAYTPSEKIKRYFFPGYWCEIYSNTRHIPWLFYLKLIFIAGWLVVGSLILFKRFT